MAKLSQKGRDRLVRIMQDERAEQRCTFVQGYTKKAKELTVEDDNEIDIVKRELMTLEASRLRLERHKQYLISIKDKKLEDANLSNFNIAYGTCNLSGRPPKLEAFDVETRNMEKEILER